jgi:hypothetical protein
MTREKVERQITMQLADGKWRTAENLRKEFHRDQADTFWAAMSHLYKTQRIQRAFDVHGVTIYRLAPR